jgi:hypothetical protein
MGCGRRSLKLNILKGFLLLWRKKDLITHFWKGLMKVNDHFLKPMKKLFGMVRTLVSGLTHGVVISPWL